MKRLSELLQPIEYGASRAACNLAILTILAFTFTLPARAEIVVAALGDSLTQGYGLPQGDGFVPQLQNWLIENGAEDVRLVNAGVSGDTTAGGLARIGWTLDGTVDAVIVNLGGNDLLRGIEPSNSRANLDAILAEISAQGLQALLVSIPAPANYGPDYKAEYDAIFPDLSAKYDTLLYTNFLQALGDTDDPASLARVMQGDFTHPNAQGLALIVAAIGPTVLQLVEKARANQD